MRVLPRTTALTLSFAQDDPPPAPPPRHDLATVSTAGGFHHRIASRDAPATSVRGSRPTMTGCSEVTTTGITIPEAKLRRWLTLLRRPDQLATTELADLLKAVGKLPAQGSTLAVGQAAADLLIEKIDSMRPPGDPGREEQLPHLVLKTCFVEGAKLFQAAGKLGLSERQLTRERSRAITLLKAELEASARAAPARTYRPEPIPSIRGYLSRPGEVRRLKRALTKRRLAHVHGPPGVGKTSLVADLATEVTPIAPVLWYRFRPEINTSLGAVLFEIGNYLHQAGYEELGDFMDKVLPDVDSALATRFALKGLGDSAHLLVFDDFHLVETELPIVALLDEFATRLPQVNIVTIGRHRYVPTASGAPLEVAPFSMLETRSLLRQLGVECDEDLGNKLHAWTQGNAHLVKLASSWLKTATSAEVSQGLGSLEHQEEVLDFLLSNVTDLLDSDDRAILEAASIFRDRCSDDALALVAGTTRGVVVDASLRLVRAYVATRNKEGDSAFFHSTVRDYVYDRLEPGHRAELHLRAASWYRRVRDTREASYHRRKAAQAEAEVG